MRLTPLFAKLLLPTVLLGIATAGGIAAEEPSWPCFHGPRGDNLSTETGLLKQWPKEGPKLLWTAKGIGTGYSSVAIADGSIYTNGSIGDNETVTALGLDGQIRWQVPNGKTWAHSHPGTALDAHG